MNIKILSLMIASSSLASGQIVISEVNSNGTGGDFFEVYNAGASPINLEGWRWNDNEASFDGAKAVTISGLVVPAGGIAVILQNTTATGFRTAWNDLPTSVTVGTFGGPGLGRNDAVVLFNSAGNFVAGVNYGATAVTVTQGNLTTQTLAPLTRTNGSPSAGEHTGLATGGGNAKLSAIWDPNSGTNNPRYTFAAVGVLESFAQNGDSATVGSPGAIGSGPIGNVPPSFATPAQAYGVEGFNLASSLFFVQAVDPNPGQSVTLSLRSGPSWLGFNSLTGQFTGVPTARGDFPVVIRATDNGSPAEFSEQEINLTIFAESAPVLLNEFNAVAENSFLGGGDGTTSTPADSHFGRILGNGGEWVEFVVVGNGSAGSVVDMRGWEVEISGPNGMQMFKLSQDPYWANVVAGTILTFTGENTAGGGLGTEIHRSSALNSTGVLWSNVWVKDAIFIDQEGSNYSLPLGIGNSNTLFTLKNGSNQVVFGPAGEGIATGGTPPGTVGVSGTEILKLEADPQPFVDPYFSPYNDGSTSSFGAPNSWAGGDTTQSFTPYLRPNSPPRFTTTPKTQAYGSYSYSVSTIDPNGQNVSLSASGLPSFLTLTAGAAGTATLSNNRPLTLADAGFYPIRIVANDGQGANNLTPQAFILTVFHNAPTVILNEYNAVSATQFLGGIDAESVDTHFGRVLGNGGPWVEFVVVGDGGTGVVDLRGWTFEIGTSEAGLPFEMINSLTLTQDAKWSAVRAGTILTFIASNEAGGGMDTSWNHRDRSSTLGDSWTNVWMGDTQYVTVAGALVEGDTVTGIAISNNDTQFLVKNAMGQIINGPGGEGIAPLSGVSAIRVFELEGAPSPSVPPFITSDDSVSPPREGYDFGGSGSTFGWPNEWQFGIAGATQLQDFSPYVEDLGTAGYSAWVGGFAGLASISPLADPDGDTRTNWDEYVFGGNPGVSDAPAPAVFSVADGVATWEFDLRNDADLENVIKRSADLETWVALAGNQASIELNPHPTMAGFYRVSLVTDPANLTVTGGKIFFRAEVSPK